MYAKLSKPLTRRSMGSASWFTHRVIFECHESWISNLAGPLCEEHSNTLTRYFIRCCTVRSPMSQRMDFYQYSQALDSAWKLRTEREWADINFPACRIQLLERKCNFSRTEGVGATSEVQLWGANMLWNTYIKRSHANDTHGSSVWETL